MLAWWWRLGLGGSLLGGWCLVDLFVALCVVSGRFWLGLVAWGGRWSLWCGGLGFVLAVWVVGRLRVLWWVGGLAVVLTSWKRTG